MRTLREDIDVLKNKYQFRKESCLPALYLALISALCFNPRVPVEADTFNRIIGYSQYYGTDVSKRILNFSAWYMIIFPLFFILYYVLIHNILFAKSKDENKEIHIFLRNVTIAGLIPLVIFAYTKFQTQSTIDILFKQSIGVGLIASFIILTVYYVALRNKNTTDISFDTFKWILFILLSLCFSINSLIKIFLNNAFIPLYITSGILVILILSIILLKKKTDISDHVKYSFSLFSFSAGLLSVFGECCNILNQYNIFLPFREQICVLILILILGICLFRYSLLKNGKIKSTPWTLFMYSGLIFSYGMVSSLLPLQVTVTADIFEDANHALSISEFFLYGKLPILETFDAHMFSKSMWGFLYTFLNQDLSGGIFCTYEVYINVVLIIILWILLRNMFHQDFAFLATVFFPISLLSYSIMIPILSVLFMINALHKRSFRSFLLFWFSLALTCLFSLDAGFSACLTSILLVVLTYLQKRKEFKKRNIILPFVFVVSFFIIIFIVLSLFRNVNLIDVTREFLSVSLSNENWGIGLGDAERPIFSFVYVIVPFSLVISFAYILYYRYKNNIHPLSTSFLLVSSFAIMYFINLSRILVRHTASENGLINLFYTSLFFFLFLAVILRPKRKELFFSVGVVLFVLLLAFARNAPFRDTYEGVFEKSINNTAFEQILADYPKVKVERVNLSNDTLLETRNVLNMINAVIDERDTYIDFTNHSLIYYLSGHEKPVYINQSPGLLSGESAQLSFLKQAKAKQPKFVLMPVRDNYLSAFLDGINNSARYYLVSEYIYKNYVPLCKTDSYALWIQKENHSEYVAAIRNMDSYQDSFSTVDIQAFSSNLSFEDAYSVVDNKIIINCEGQRPIVRNLESIFDYAGLVASASNLTIQVECSSDIDGSVQFIQEGADERRMKAFSLFGNENKCLTFNVSVDKETQIYLMPPVDSHFIIHSISILNNDCPFILVSYETAADKDVHSFDLGMIPYLWGNVDSGSAWANPVISRAIINKGDYFSIDPSQTSEPKYILLTVDSLDRGSASLQFGLWKDGVFTPLNDFSFEILPGEGNKYILRPSMDFFWYSGKINAAVISSENDMTAVDIQLLEDDSI